MSYAVKQQRGRVCGKKYWAVLIRQSIRVWALAPNKIPYTGGEKVAALAAPVSCGNNVSQRSMKLRA